MTLCFDYTNGFHDSANAIATAVSTRALTPRAALIIAALMNVAGALISTKVARTVGGGIIEPPSGRGGLVVDWPRCSAPSRGTSPPGGSACPRPPRTH